MSAALGPLFFGGLCLGTFSLGTWQTLRYNEKVELMTAQDARLAEIKAELARPRPEVNTATAPEEGKDPRLVAFHRLTGTFDHSRQVLLGPRGPPLGAISDEGPDSGRSGAGLASSPQGYWVLTPFEVEGNEGNVGNEGVGGRGGKEEVLVMRGWEPIDQARGGNQRENKNKNVRRNDPSAPRPSPITNLHPLPTGKTTLTTVSVAAEVGGMFAPPPVIANTVAPTLLWLSSPAMAQLTKLRESQTQKLFKCVHATKTPPGAHLLQPTIDAAVEFKVSPETHAGYAVTWFSLSAAGVAMTRKLLRSVPK